MEFSALTLLATSTCFYWSIDTYFDPHQSFFFRLYSPFCCVSINHIMFKYIHLYIYIYKLSRKGEQVSYSYIYAFILYLSACGQEKLSPGMHCRVLMISSYEKKEKDNQVSEKVSLATLPSFLFIVIEIDKRVWWLIVDTDDRAQMLTKQVTLWLLLFDYAHTTFSHTTPKCIAVCAVNSIDYAYFLFFILFILIFFSHIMWNLNPLDSDQSSTQTDIYLAIIENVYVFVGILIFQKKKVSINIIWWESLVCMCGKDGLCLFRLSVRLFLLSLIVEIRKWASACARVNTGQKKLNAFDVTAT
jgi:hypothetical protein